MDGALELGIGVALMERARQKGSPSCQDSLTHCVGQHRHKAGCDPGAQVLPEGS